MSSTRMIQSRWLAAVMGPMYLLKSVASVGAMLKHWIPGGRLLCWLLPHAAVHGTVGFVEKP